MPDIKLADISEFQQNIDAPAYLKAGHQVLIVRTHNGYRPDHLMPGRRDYVRKFPFIVIGYYQYLVQDRAPQTQAREFIATVGELLPNEFVILDHEEGSGNQTLRAEAWFAVVDPWAKMLASLYSGASMLQTQLGGVTHWGKRPLWIADYFDFTPNPIHEPHGCDWWQYTDRESFAGITGKCDGSIFHGTAQQFLAMAQEGAPVKPKPPVAATDQVHSFVSVVKQDGRIEIFEETISGEVLHKWQTAKDNGWAEQWSSLGKP